MQSKGDVFTEINFLLFLSFPFKYSKSKKIDRPMGNLSQAFGEIKLVFKDDSTFKAYFDNQINTGNWKIKNDSIYMTQYNNETIWNSFKYKLVNNELYIYSDPWLMALKKQN